MRISIAVMAHPDRDEQANELVKLLKTMPFFSVWLSFDMNDNEWMNGRRCVQWGATTEGQTDWHVVIQDDAIISVNFFDNLVRALESVPRKSLVSLYTGTVRPEQERVVQSLYLAGRENASWLSSNSLYWGVAVAIPTDDIESLLEKVEGSILPYDRRLGSYFASKYRCVYYTVPSLVDHDHTLPSIVGNDREGPVRKAHNYESGPVEFNKDVVRIV